MSNTHPDPATSVFPAAIINNEGVGKLRVGDYGAAREIFDQAVIILKGLVDDEQLRIDEENFRVNRRLRWVPLSSSSSSSDTAQTTNESEESFSKDTSGLFILRSALIMTPTAQEGYISYTLEELCAVIFNSGLANHLPLIDRSNGCSLCQRRDAIHARRALGFYDLALNLLMVNDGPMGYVSSVASSSLALALLNNKGVLQHELCQFNTARDTFQELLNLWANVEVHNQSGQTRAHFNDPNAYPELAMNLYLICSGSQSAPAA